MKSDKLRIALESLKGSISSETDAVELTGQTARATDNVWWAEATLPDPIPTPMTLPYSKLRSIVRSLDEEDEIEIEPTGPTCRVKAPATLWQLSLLNVPTEPPPEFQAINTIEASGYALLEAYKSLKHLIRTDLSRPGLMWAWTNENQELVIGDGSRLAGHHTGIKDLELPVIVLSEVCRILTVRLSEKVTFHSGDIFIRADMRDIHFQATLPNGPRFDTEWYNKVRNLVNEDPHVIKLSRSEIIRAVNQVGITAGESTVNLTSRNGTLILTAVDEYGNKSATKIEAFGELKESISLNIDHLSEAIKALTEELIIIKVCKSAVELSDKAGWEVIIRR
jgi:DNA polymerase III sliding clamp (beta) subunit (PCNA family)